MTLMIRSRALCLLLCLPIAACSASPVLTSAFRNLQAVTTGFPDAPVTREYVDGLPYASVQAKIGKGPRSLLVLGEKDGQRLRWVSADGAVIVTENGRITKTANIPDDDLTGTRFPAGDVLDLLPGLPDGAKMQRLVDLKDRDLFGVPVFSTLSAMGLETVQILGKPMTLMKYVEQNEAPLLKWSFQNEFYADPETGFIWFSRQWVTPDLPVFEVAVTKPANGN